MILKERSFAAVCTAMLMAASILVSPVAEACTRFVYHGVNDEVITARSMDWKRDVGTNLWVFPRGMKRSGEAGPNSVRWTSKYGSVIASACDISITDGMNEAGLVANVLHLSLSDAGGDGAIIEYIDGKQVIHHSRDYQVMTNSPVFEKQLALNEYWKQIGGTVMLPGTNRASGRFARASFYVNAIPKSEDPVEAIASVFSVIRNVSVPFGITTPDQPNISSTRWRTVSDHKRKLYFFESALTPNVFWVDLTKLDFSEETGKVMKLDLGANQVHIYSGMANDQFKEAAPFKFQGL